MRASIIQIDGPTVEPITAIEVKASARIDGTEFDSQIALIIPALRRNVEGRLGCRLINQTVELVMDGFPAADIDLQLPNVSSIVSVKYLDVDGAEQTLANTAYALNATRTPCYLTLANGQAWPATIDVANAVRVRFVTGFGDTASAVPDDIRLWMIAHAVRLVNSPSGFGNSGLEPMPFVDSLLDQYKVWRVA